MPKPARDADSPAPISSYPGERLGLPREGAGSIAGFGRRVIGLAIDWGIAVAISWAFFDYDALAVTIAFVVHTAVTIMLIGGSIGHTVCGMRLNTVDMRPPGLWRPWVRQILLVLVLPAVIWDQDHRGGHDIISGLVLRRFSR